MNFDMNKYGWFGIFVSVFTSIGVAIYMNMVNPFVEIDEIVDNNPTDIIQLDVRDNQVDIAIKNVIVYPNLDNKNSLYVDIDIENIDGDEKVQISLSNGSKLIGSDQILLEPKQKTYSQSFLLEESVDFDSKFYVKISSLKFEKNI